MSTPAWNDRMAVIVLRVDNPKALPEGIFSDEEAITFLKDGSFVMAGGVFKIGSTERAVEAIAEAFHFGREPLAFHQDPRGVRWARLAEFIDTPTKKMKVPGSGTFHALEIDYESVVSKEGVWVSVEEVYARIARQKAEGDKSLKEWGRKMSALADSLPDSESEMEASDAEGADETPEVEEREVRNVVVVIKSPKKLPKEVEVLATLGDGTKLIVGPKSRSWVDALKKNPGPGSLRLIKGPIALGELTAFRAFAELDLSMRARGTPMLVMPG